MTPGDDEFFLVLFLSALGFVVVLILAYCIHRRFNRQHTPQPPPTVQPPKSPEGMELSENSYLDAARGNGSTLMKDKHTMVEIGISIPPKGDGHEADEDGEATPLRSPSMAAVPYAIADVTNIGAPGEHSTQYNGIHSTLASTETSRFDGGHQPVMVPEYGEMEYAPKLLTELRRDHDDGPIFELSTNQPIGATIHTSSGRVYHYGANSLRGSRAGSRQSSKPGSKAVSKAGSVVGSRISSRRVSPERQMNGSGSNSQRGSQVQLQPLVSIPPSQVTIPMDDTISRRSSFIIGEFSNEATLKLAEIEAQRDLMLKRASIQFPRMENETADTYYSPIPPLPGAASAHDRINVDDDEDDEDDGDGSSTLPYDAVQPSGIHFAREVHQAKTSLEENAPAIDMTKIDRNLPYGQVPALTNAAIITTQVSTQADEAHSNTFEEHKQQ